MTDPLPLPEETYLCAICGKPVDLRTCKTDANGQAVHLECISGKLRGKRE